MEALKYISADSHVVEPAEFWVTRLDKKYQDQAPRVIVKESKEGTPTFAFRLPGLFDLPILAELFAAGQNMDSSRELLREDADSFKKFVTSSAGYDQARPGAWDPIERIKDQELDGVSAEVLYTSLGMPLYQITDTELQQACFSVYNTWLGEFCSSNPKRLLGLALISMWDIPSAIKELQRCAKIGLRGAEIWGNAPEDKPYSNPMYDPFWAAAQDLNMPISLHVGTSVMPRRPGGGGTMLSSRMEGFTNAIHPIQQAIAALTLNGVLERYPGMKIVSAENDVGWLPHLVWRLDHAYRHYGVLSGIKLKEMPSFYLKRQLFGTFEDEPFSADSLQRFGADNFMWASDYPHGVSTWPRSRNAIEKDFAGVPKETRQKIILENVKRCYNIEA
jgi:predicted TIM-barrel fold metal-dependent hydrolase